MHLEHADVAMFRDNLFSARCQTRELWAVELAGSVSWLDDVKGDMNHALVSLGLVAYVSNCCLGFLFFWL